MPFSIAGATLNTYLRKEYAQLKEIALALKEFSASGGRPEGLGQREQQRLPGAQRCPDSSSSRGKNAYLSWKQEWELATWQRRRDYRKRCDMGTGTEGQDVLGDTYMVLSG